MPFVNQELLTIPEHMCSPPGFSGLCVTRSLVVCFVDSCFSFLFFPFGHCVVCPSSIYGFRLPLSASSNSYIWFIQYYIWTFHFKEYLVVIIICIFIHGAFRIQGNIERIIRFEQITVYIDSLKDVSNWVLPKTKRRFKILV